MLAVAAAVGGVETVAVCAHCEQQFGCLHEQHVDEDEHLLRGNRPWAAIPWRCLLHFWAAVVSYSTVFSCLR